jgi:hypothetical protein
VYVLFLSSSGFPLLFSFGYFLSYSFSICHWFFYIYLLSFLLWSKFLDRYSMLRLCAIVLTVTWYVLLSTAETFSASQRKRLHRSCTYLLKQDLSAL